MTLTPHLLLADDAEANHTILCDKLGASLLAAGVRCRLQLPAAVCGLDAIRKVEQRFATVQEQGAASFFVTTSAIVVPLADGCHFAQLLRERLPSLRRRTWARSPQWPSAGS